jgi:hypothetical protein
VTVGREAEDLMVKRRGDGVIQDHWRPLLAAPDYWLQGGLQTDFHVQGIGALEVDFDVDVTDDDLICQVEGVAVGGVGFVPLYRRE